MGQEPTVLAQAQCPQTHPLTQSVGRSSRQAGPVHRRQKTRDALEGGKRDSGQVLPGAKGGQVTLCLCGAAGCGCGQWHQRDFLPADRREPSSGRI